MNTKASCVVLAALVVATSSTAFAGKKPRDSSEASAGDYSRGSMDRKRPPAEKGMGGALAGAGGHAFEVGVPKDIVVLTEAPDGRSLGYLADSEGNRLPPNTRQQDPHVYGLMHEYANRGNTSGEADWKILWVGGTRVGGRPSGGYTGSGRIWNRRSDGSWYLYADLEQNPRYLSPEARQWMAANGKQLPKDFPETRDQPVQQTGATESQGGEAVDPIKEGLQKLFKQLSR